MPLDDRDYVRGTHPATCTCADCVEERLRRVTTRNRLTQERSGGGASRWLLLVGAVVVAFVVGVLLAPSSGPTIDRLTERIEEALAPTPTVTIVRGRSMAEPVVALQVATPTPTAPAAVAPTPTAQAAASEPTPTPVPQVSLRSFTNGLWLEAEDPSLAASIKELDWVQDGIQGPETAVVQGLLDVAARDRSVASSVVALEWVQDGADDVEVGAIEWLGNIADTRVASAVVSLTWVRDGVDDTEVKVIETLSYIANREANVGLSLVASTWVRDGVDGAEAVAIGRMDNFEDARVASAVIHLGWVRDGIDDTEARAIQTLSNIANRNADVGLSVVSLGWVQDGIDDVDAVALAWMANIKGAEVASSLVSLDWVQDGVSAVETKAVQELSYLANRHADVGLSVITLGWAQDGIDDVEVGVLDWVGNIVSAEVASSVVSLGWVQDGIEDVEVRAVEELSYLANRHARVGLAIIALGWAQDGINRVEAGAIEWVGNILSAEVASSVVSLGWMQDGIEDMEVKTVEELSYLANRHPDVGLSVIAMGWAQDGIDRVEAGAIEWVGNILNAEVASSVVSLGWMQDGIEDMEVTAIEELSYLANRDAGAALRIMDMQFVETLEPPDVSALTSLRQLAAFRPDAFARVMGHDALRDGVTDELAPIVAMLNGVSKTNPGLIDVLLDPSRLSLEQRTIELPLSGDVVLSIVRTTLGAPRSMDLLEHSVRGAEEFMNTPLPTRYVGLLYENSVSGTVAGTNFGTHVAILPRYDVDDGSYEAAFSGHIIAHEVAHYYWSGNADWLDEGAADFMASMIDSARTGRPLGVTNLPCAYVANIAELEALEVARDDVEFTCNYSFGERLFVDLHRTLGEERFAQGFRELYRDESLGIEHVREAFSSTGDDEGEKVVIARWYDGIGPFPFPVTEPADPSLPSIGGQIDFAYVAIGQYGSPASALSRQNITDWVYLVFELSYNVSGEHELPLKIVEYYQDGFEFRHKIRVLTAEEQYSGGTWWFSIGFSPSREWALGRYSIQVYTGERKIAEVEYEVTA